QRAAGGSHGQAQEVERVRIAVVVDVDGGLAAADGERAGGGSIGSFRASRGIAGEVEGRAVQGQRLVSQARGRRIAARRSRIVEGERGPVVHRDAGSSRQ